MLSEKLLHEIQNRIESNDCEPSAENLREEAKRLLAEVHRLKGVVQDFSSRVVGKLQTLETDMALLEKENQRQQTLRISACFERDACIGLIAQLASAQGITVGRMRAEVDAQTQNFVVMDLPSGQVSWDYLDEDAHLFESLPKYSKPLQPQSVKEVYAKVLNPGLDF